MPLTILASTHFYRYSRLITIINILTYCHGINRVSITIEIAVVFEMTSIARSNDENAAIPLSSCQHPMSQSRLELKEEEIEKIQGWVTVNLNFVLRE